jgi:hypothetical protein
MSEVAALFVDPKGFYAGRSDVDVWMRSEMRGFTQGHGQWWLTRRVRAGVD